jgi:hypothetical protein
VKKKLVAVPTYWELLKGRVGTVFLTRKNSSEVFALFTGLL